MEIQDFISELKEIIAKGGPIASEYEYLNKATLTLRGISSSDEAKLYEAMRPILSLDSMIGHTFLKPYGYAGDFDLINKIYNKYESQDNSLIKWDKLYHAADSAEAVRNRKKYFIDLVIQSTKNTKSRVPNVLNLGSGPCTDLYEYLHHNPSNKIIFDCVDMDQKAIDFATITCDNYIDNINFINQNVFRLKTTKQYDLIWSAGLFDYFSDKLFIRLIQRTYSMLAINGLMVVGNFSTNNPSRGLMEIFCQWYLHHRNEQTLTHLAIEAGVPSNKIQVKAEATGINLFLYLRK